MKKLLFALLLLASGRAIFAQPLTSKRDSLTFKEERIVSLEDGSTDTVNCSSYFHYLWFTGPEETAARLNKQMYLDLLSTEINTEDELRNALNEGFNDWASEWQSQFVAEDSSPLDFSYNLNWYEESYFGFEQTGNTVTVSYSLDGYYGGAHPNGGITYKVYALPAATPVDKWQDLFTDTMPLLRMAESTFRKEKNLQPGASLSEAGYWFQNDKFHLTNNFGFDETGIFFLFNRYEVASYADGPVAINIPYNQLKHWLKKPL